MEMLEQLATEVTRYAECDGDLIGDKARNYSRGVVEALEGVSSLLRLESNRNDPQDSTSG